jgi:UDP-N-acetylmuramoyl-tripeptide--D-alanyl-D-alanine ligase
MDNQIDKIYSEFLAHPVISTDSRQVQPGSIFFALRGDSFNGNEFAAKAIQSGASIAIVDEKRYACGESFILVDDVLATLQNLALHHRNQFNIPVIAVTGTNGKTTTKELIYSVLSKRFRVLATHANLNNHIGVPITLLNLTAETEIAIIEMGANHPGEIDLLCNIAKPDYGLITNIGKAHLEGFGSFEGVIKTKTELYRFISKNGGEIFLNNNDEILKEYSNGLKINTYGTTAADLYASHVSADPYVNVDLQFRDGTKLRVESKLYGGYNANNILAAVCIGQRFEVPPLEIKTAIEEYQPANNRSQIFKSTRNLLILDAYNANPSSMKAAIDAFAATAYTEKTIILGDMLELGENSDEEHLHMLECIAKDKFSQVYLVGPIFTRLNTKRENLCFQDTELAKMWFEHFKIENATILIKGSRGIRLEKLVEYL